MKKNIRGRRKHYDIGKDHPRWKGGKERFKCKCGKTISFYAKQCSNCYASNIKGENNPLYKQGKPKCIDCGIQLKDYTSKRCRHHAKIYQYKINPNSNPMKNNKHTNITKNKISKTLKTKQINIGKKNGMFGKPTPHGKRLSYKNIWMRSSWEIAYAKYLDNQKIKWLYEPKAFDLNNGYTYRPDFYLPKSDTYIEIKGYWRDKAKMKFNLFKKLYSKLKIKLIMEEELKWMKIIK